MAHELTPLDASVGASLSSAGSLPVSRDAERRAQQGRDVWSQASGAHQRACSSTACASSMCWMTCFIELHRRLLRLPTPGDSDSL